MSRISHSVTVAAVPRPWFEQTCAMLHRLVRETHAEDGRVLLPDGRPVAGVRLLTGDHLAPGAVYAFDPGPRSDSVDGRRREREQVRITGRRRGNDPGLRLEHVLGDEGTVTVLEGVLRDIGRPAAAELSGSVRVAGRGESLRRVHGHARVDLRAWWQAAEGRRCSGDPFEAHLEHRFAAAALRARPQPRSDGRWDVRLVVSLRGRSVLRPVAALGLLLCRGRVRRAVADAVDSMARDWNGSVPDTVARDVRHLREDILDAAASPWEGDTCDGGAGLDLDPWGRA